MEPINQERLDAFWKRWGFKDNDAGWSFNGKPINRWDELPDLNIDSLFKYAVPGAKVTEIEFGNFESDGVTCEVWSGLGGMTVEVARADTPALALFLALEKLKEVER